MREPALAVPRSAVVREGLREYVFVRKDGKFERRLVETGRSDDRYVEINAYDESSRRGLRLGEEIAVHGAADLQTAYAALR